MTPVSCTQEARFFMGKLSYDDKINLYNGKKKGMSLKSLAIKYNARTKNAQYLYCIIEKH